MKTYLLVNVGDDKEAIFTDPKAAGAAWFQADVSAKPHIILTHDDGSASHYAMTFTTSADGVARLEKSLPVDNLREGDQAFRAGFFEAMLQSQGVGEGAVYEAKPGQRYSGPIVVNGGEHFLQQVASKTYIAHPTEAYPAMPEPGKNVTIHNATLTQDETYLTYQALSQKQQDQAAARFSGHRLDDYRYQLDKDGGVLCRKPERDFERQVQGFEH
jgi:hypothetical protein